MAGFPDIEVNVRNIAVGGAGVGEVTSQSDASRDLLGITAFVPFASPGERVLARVQEKKDRYLKAELIEVLEPSPARVAPSCRYFTNCGGCELQHLSYPAQCEAKFEMLRSSLQAAKFGKDVLSSLAPLVTSQELNYRRRVTLHVDRSGRIGLYRSRSRSVVPIESCSVATPQINDALSSLSLSLFCTELPSKKLSSILLEEDDQGLVAILKSPYDLTRSDVDVILEQAKQVFPNLVLIAAGKEVGGAGRQILELPLNDKKTFFIRLPAGYFSQVNWNINLSLIKRVVEAAQLSYGDKVYDLYAGAGNFTLPLARSGGQVTAVECDSRLAGFGRDNIKRHNLDKKVLFLEQSVEEFLKDKSVFKDVSLVVADPPRSGLGNLLPQLNFSQRFLLISCHLPSFVRDLRGFAEMGWSVDSIEPFDMFPQTSYLEILAVLSKH